MAEIKQVGYTKFPNDLTEALCGSRLGSLELRAIIYLWRTTNGYRFKGVPQTERTIGLAEWTQALWAKKSHVSVALKSLEAKRIVIRQPLGIGKGYTYSLNMPEEWLPVTEKVTVTESGTVTEEVTEQLPNTERNSYPLSFSNSAYKKKLKKKT